MSDEWVESTLGDVAQVIGGGTPSTKQPEYWNGDIPWLTPTEIVARDGEVVSTSERMITELGLEKSSAKLMPEGAILVTSRASVGFVALAGRPVATNQGFQSLVAGPHVLPEFLMFWVQANREEFRRRASGSTFPEVSKAKVASVAIRYPLLPVQRRIVDLMTHLDAHIANLGVVTGTDTALGSESASLKTLRDSLLSELLNGKRSIPIAYDSLLPAVTGD